MTDGENYITLPNFLIPYRDGGVSDYADAPETVGKIVLAVASKVFRGADISANLSPCERGVYRHWLKVAEDGLEKAMRERVKMQNLAAKRWGKTPNGEPSQAANPSPCPAGSGAGAVVPVSKYVPIPAHTPAPVATVRQSVPNPSASGGERRGGLKMIGAGVDPSVSWFTNPPNGIEDRINADPVGAALEITGETGSKLSENTLKKYLRLKGEGAFIDTLYAFNSELKNGEDVGKRGAALNARLKALPDIPAGVGK